MDLFFSVIVLFIYWQVWGGLIFIVYFICVFIYWFLSVIVLLVYLFAEVQRSDFCFIFYLCIDLIIYIYLILF